MIDDLLKNAMVRRFFPPIAALLLIALFIQLAFWQLDRAAEKNALQALFSNDAPAVQLSDNVDIKEYQRIETSGQYVGDRQILVDNIVLDGRVGFYVLTAFQYAENKPWLIVNRGWLAKSGTDNTLPDVSTGTEERSLLGRVGRLPRVAIRSGESFEETDVWPKRAIYPSLQDVSRQIEAEVLPFILLLDPDAADGFVRRWQIDESGPRMHYGYAFQWFAMATAVLVILIWQLRKRRRNDRN